MTEEGTDVKDERREGGKDRGMGGGRAINLYFLFLSPSILADIEGCEHSWRKFHGHCYRYFSRRHTWEDAEKDCREHSGHLASIHSAAEQNFIRGLSHDNTWIGLNDRTVEDDFQWTDKTDLVRKQLLLF
ncbi:hypothetical protein CHARACLAT_010154 [Characodon lateralis]|uniref:C-type lectin domain-containing protein n=1 Tax=Characodon lateralis TaxID=208331 RepID=A0ABU7DJ43_9TELE|nr:hypothetical protein [Characodon lateralis]